jgi:hypothetical protein
MLIAIKFAVNFVLLFRMEINLMKLLSILLSVAQGDIKQCSQVKEIRSPRSAGWLKPCEQVRFHQWMLIKES